MLGFNDKHRIKATIEAVLMGVALACVAGMAYFFMPAKGSVIVINCSISEISPDFTPAMREACRQVRAEKFKEDLRKPK